MRNAVFFAGMSCALFTSITFAAKLDIETIDRAAGAKGEWNDGEKAYRLSFPREMRLPPAFATMSWATFQTGREKPALMLGGFVLLAAEVNPAIDAALASGLEVTALFDKSPLGEKPIYALHVGGEGTAAEMAAGVRRIRDAIANTKPQAPSSANDDNGAISAAALDAIFGGKGTTEGGVYKIAWPREATMPCGCKVSSAMGFATSVALCGSDERAIAAGAIACAYGEMQGALKALRRGNIDITAIANHTDAEAPRTLFVHFTARGRAADLAKTIKSAIDAQKVRGGAHQHHQH